MMIIPPEVKRINQQLVNHFGVDTSTGQAMWRVVWSDDQFEKRLMDCTDEGLYLLHPEVREVPKYRQWIPSKWVLEQLVAIPSMNEKELPCTKVSYEPMFPFEDKNGNALPPKFEAAKFVIDAVYAALGKTSLAKYKDPEEGNPNAQKERIDKICEELFGDENDTTDALAYGEGIGYTGPSFKEPVKES